MKRNPIIKEYKNVDVSGLEVMKETTNFLASKLMDIEDIINISYYICPSDIQIYNVATDPTLLNFNFDPSIKMYYELIKNINYDKIKQQYITLEIDKKQTDETNNHNTVWKFRLDTIGLLKEYLYHELYVYNKQTEFYNITNSNYIIKDLVKDYIEKNIIDKYRFKQFKLYVKYYELSNNKIPALSYGATLDKDVQLLLKQPQFDIKAIPANDNKIEVISIDTNDNRTMDIYYKQLKSSKQYTYIYYYDIIFERI